MKKIFLSSLFFLSVMAMGCKKNDDSGLSADAVLCPNNPRTNVSASLQGNWMYGNFSMTEYWSTNPSTYLGNALQFAIAFKFNANGTFEQYFTSSSVSGTVVTYQQSVTKGTVVIDEGAKTIKTYACSAHYKRTSNGQTVEERDLAPSELTTLSTYNYTHGTEPNGTKNIALVLNGAGNPLTFVQKF